VTVAAVYASWAASQGHISRKTTTGFGRAAQSSHTRSLVDVQPRAECCIIVVRPLLSQFVDPMSVQQAGQPARSMGSDGDLLDDADTAALAHRCDYEVLEVD
jgi:hypothetical protein